ncbi:MAG TPA: exodeoxyribonuclease VII large subunit [Terriglobales bacterium]|nr:exodeoxyribonuclease VII large subunit [Terriglobales bacterium]
MGFNFQGAPPQRKLWKVGELVSSVRTNLERSFPDVWVQGEISNFKPADSGHFYFTLKDGEAQLRTVMWRTTARLLRFKPENGMNVTARGRVTLYEVRGELQLQAEYLEPQGAGALQVAFEQLKAKLAAEGLFAQDRKKVLPALPKKIGIVTSPRGAAIQDMLNILRRRHESVHVVIFPVQVQGESASGEISAGIRFFNSSRMVDVIVVARGGGSVEDLWAFNDEGLARTIAASTLPVISAVGHETDFTISDFVADLRAPTPSAAAELVIQSKYQLSERVESLRTRASRAIRYQLLLSHNALGALAQRGTFARIRDLIARRGQRVDELVFRLAEAQRRHLRNYHRRLENASARVRAHDLRAKLVAMRRDVAARTNALAAVARNVLLHHRARLDRFAAQLEALSPVAILDRGYALVFDSSGNLLKDVAQLNSGETVRTRLARGEFTAGVREIKQG